MNNAKKLIFTSVFHCTQAFLTGVLQNYARKYRVAVDRLSFAFTILKDKDDSSIKQAPEDGCFVHGILLEGCRWDSEMNTLVGSISFAFTSSCLVQAIPVFIWVLAEETSLPGS